MKEKEMLSKAEVKYIRISTRKARLVADLIKGKTVEDAISVLDNVNKRACVPIKKLVNSAFSNANNERQEKLLSKDVVVSVIRADGGPMLYRYRAATMGRATPVRHRTSHLYVELKEKEAPKAKKKGKGKK